jgi:hypothetical protein
MTESEKKKPGPRPEVLKVPLTFEDAVEAALKTLPPPKASKPKK